MQELDLSKLDGLDEDTLDNMKVEIDKELIIANSHFGLVESKDFELGKKILELRIQKNDNQIVLGKAKDNIKKLSIQRRILESLFWKKRNNR